MSKYISKVIVPGWNSHLELLYPHDNRLSAINVICGENYAGKSFLLSKIRKTYATEKSDMDGIHIEYRGDLKSGEPIYFRKPWDIKKRVGGYSLGTKKDIDSGEGPPILKYLLHFCYENVFESIDSDIMADQFCDPKNNEARFQIFMQAGITPDETQFLPCKPDHPIVKRLENIMPKKRLYYRFMKIGGKDAPTDPARFEVMLVDANDRAIMYDQWSDGQQMIFLLLLSLHYHKTDLVLLDEIENHLHPTYISTVLGMIKEFPAQSIIVTHHPHVIFSRYPDRIVYIANGDPPYTSTERKIIIANKGISSYSKSFSRNITTLEDDAQKIESAYKLFDDKDNYLLRLSKHFARSVEVDIYRALSRLVGAYAPVHASSKVLADSQTERLFCAASQQFKETTELRILDIGAGYGRVMEELKKVSGINDHIQWYLFNVDKTQADKARTKFVDDCRVISIAAYEEVENKSIDIAIVANVVHEIAPPAFAKIIHQAYQKLKMEGFLLILEMDPLLHPEKYAVSYSYTDLTDLFGELQWDSYPTCENYRSVNLFCVAAKKGEYALEDEKSILCCIEQLWKKKLRRNLHSYRAQTDGFDLDGYLQITQCLASVITISTYFDKRNRSE